MNKLNLIKYLKLKEEAGIKIFEGVNLIEEKDLRMHHEICREATEHVLIKFKGKCSYYELLAEGIPYIVDKIHDDVDDDLVLYTLLNFTKHVGILIEKQKPHFK